MKKKNIRIHLNKILNQNNFSDFFIACHTDSDEDVNSFFRNGNLIASTSRGILLPQDVLNPNGRPQ